MITKKKDERNQSDGNNSNVILNFLSDHSAKKKINIKLK